ncbi:hypothetical protein Tco_0600696 [Tanacetum coccineum]
MMGKLQPKLILGIFIVGYAPTKKALPDITTDIQRKINETIHVGFDELPRWLLKHMHSGPPLFMKCDPVSLRSDSCQTLIPSQHFHAPEVIALIPESFAPEQAVSTGSPSSTTDSSFAQTAFADADQAGCQDTRRSTSGSKQHLGAETCKLCRLKGMKIAAISSTEADDIALFPVC